MNRNISGPEDLRPFKGNSGRLSLSFPPSQPCPPHLFYKLAEKALGSSARSATHRCGLHDAILPQVRLQRTPRKGCVRRPACCSSLGSGVDGRGRRLLKRLPVQRERRGRKRFWRGHSQLPPQVPWFLMSQCTRQMGMTSLALQSQLSLSSWGTTPPRLLHKLGDTQ